MGKKIIGFNVGFEQEEEEKRSGEAGRSLLEEVLDQLYAPTGTTEQKICKTSADIAYELAMTDPGITATDIAKVLHARGYRTQVIDNTVCWVLYEKNFLD